MPRVVGRIFSGIQPSGTLHLGNYLGAIKNWVHLQHEYEDVFYAIMDLHAMTTPRGYRREDMVARTRHVTATLLACGIEPARCTLFQQSQVHQHAELAWILGTVTPLGKLFRMTQFKDKAVDTSKDHAKRTSAAESNACLGLLSYPVLQAADILLYNATHVPVGEDQRQHIELARDIAQHFNAKFGAHFVLPTPIFELESARIKSLRDASAKMSKSDADESACVLLCDSADTIVHKIRRAKTDGSAGITFDKAERPEIANLLTIFAAVDESGRTAPCLAAEYAHLSTSEFKARLADALIAKVVPIGKRLGELEADVGYLDSVLQHGGIKAAEVAHTSMQRVLQLTGLRAS